MRYSGYTAAHMRGVVTVEAACGADALALAQVLRPDVVGVSETICQLFTESAADRAEAVETVWCAIALATRKAA